MCNRDDELAGSRSYYAGAPMPDDSTVCNACGEQQNAAGYCINKQCSRHGRRNDYLANDVAAPATDSPAERERRIYIASRTYHAGRWRALRDEGCPIISSWINEAGVGQTLDWRDLWDRCIVEASRASALILYAEPEDAYLKGALVEVGAALSHDVPVYLVLGNRDVAGSAWNHRLVTECESFDDALALALAASVPVEDS